VVSLDIAQRVIDRSARPLKCVIWTNDDSNAWMPQICTFIFSIPINQILTLRELALNLGSICNLELPFFTMQTVEGGPFRYRAFLADPTLPT
jgi:hypothetical protein